MWYVLAAANALSGDADLIAGTQLKVPEMAASKNDATSFRPYNPGEIVGSTSPGLPYIPPAASNACAMMVVLVLVVVAAVVAPYATQFVAQLAGVAMPAIGTAITSYSAAQLAVAATGAFIGGLAGSIASQVVGKAVGVVDHFSLRTAVNEGLIDAASFGLQKLKIGELIRKSRFATAAAQSVLRSAVSVVANKVSGIDTNFSWKSIAADALSAGISSGLLGGENNPLKKFADSGSSGWANFKNGFIGGLVREGVRHEALGEPFSILDAGMAGLTYTVGSAVHDWAENGAQAWGRRVKTGQGQDAIDLNPRYDALDPNRDGKHTKEDLMYFSASNAGTYSLAVPVDMNLLTKASSAENPFAGIEGFPGIEDDGALSEDAAGKSVLPSDVKGNNLTNKQLKLLRDLQATGALNWVVDAPGNTDVRFSPMTLSDHGTREMFGSEAFATDPYLDSQGYLTIGIGHLLDRNRNGSTSIKEWAAFDKLGFPRKGLTESQQISLYKLDINPNISAVNKSLSRQVTQSMFDALVSLTFNHGSGFPKNTYGKPIFDLINSGNYSDLPNEWYKKSLSNGIIVKGLQNRRLKEITMFATPYYKTRN